MRLEARALTVCTVLLAVGLNGCRLVVGTAVVGTYVVVGAAGLAGYTVYKGGEAVVSTVYKGGEAVVSTVGSVGSSATDSIQRRQEAVAVSRGTLKAKCDYTIAELYPATMIALEEAGFEDIAGRQDALTGTIQARAPSSGNVTVEFELLSKELTALKIRVGGGNLEQSEYLYDRILSTAAASKGGSR